MSFCLWLFFFFYIYRHQVIKLPCLPWRILSHWILYGSTNWIMRLFIFNSRGAKAIYSYGMKASETHFEYRGCFFMDEDALDLLLKAVKFTADFSITKAIQQVRRFKTLWKVNVLRKKTGTPVVGAWTGWGDEERERKNAPFKHMNNISESPSLMLHD